MEEDVLLKKLRWRCRRGMRELDQLFGRYLDHEEHCADRRARGFPVPARLRGR